MNSSASIDCGSFKQSIANQSWISQRFMLPVFLASTPTCALYYFSKEAGCLSGFQPRRHSQQHL
jgi:hypothetical protein